MASTFDDRPATAAELAKNCEKPIPALDGAR